MKNFFQFSKKYLNAKNVSRDFFGISQSYFSRFSRKANEQMPMNVAQKTAIVQGLDNIITQMKELKEDVQAEIEQYYAAQAEAVLSQVGAVITHKANWVIHFTLKNRQFIFEFDDGVAVYELVGERQLPFFVPLSNEYSLLKEILSKL